MAVKTLPVLLHKLFNDSAIFSKSNLNLQFHLRALGILLWGHSKGESLILPLIADCEAPKAEALVGRGWINSWLG